MDIITQRFIAIGNKLLAELRKVSANLTQIQEHVKIVAEQSKAEKKEDSLPPEVVARLAFPAGIDTERNASEKRKQRRDRWRLFIEVLVLIAVAGYGLVAYHQWREMQNTTTILLNGQLPWVGVEWPVLLKNPISLTPDNMDFVVAATLKNFGHSPALYAFPFAYQVWDPFQISQQQGFACEGADDMESGKSTKNISSLPGFGPVIFPQSTLPWSNGFSSNAPVNENARRFLRLYIAGCIAYRDQGNALHHTRWCVQSWIIRTPKEIADFEADGKFIPCNGNQSAD